MPNAHNERSPMRHITYAVLLALLTTACGTDQPDPGPRFDDERSAETSELTCMKHQPDPPGPRYLDKSRRQTDDTLLMLRYYTTNGTKSYCDNKAPTDTDRQWLQLYVDLGADRANIAPLLNAP